MFFIVVRSWERRFAYYCRALVNVILTTSNLKNDEKFEEKKTERNEPAPGITYIVVPPDGGWGWVIVLASFICNFVAEGTMYSYGLFLEEIANGLQTTTTNVSLANSLMTGFYFLFGPIICSMINKWGYRIVGFIGGLLASISFVLSSFAPEISVLIVTYGLIGGIGFGMLYMPSVIAIGFYFEKWRGVANSVSLCGSAVGSISIPIVISVSMKDLNWMDKFRCFSGFALFCALCTLLYKPLQPLEVQTEPQQDSDSEDEDFTPYKATFNKLNNQSYRRLSVQSKGGSMYSIRRVGSPYAMSLFSFKSYTSTTKSMFKGSRLSDHDDYGCCETCCHVENCKHTCMLLCCSCKRCGRNPARPMYRDDILYTGSVANLPKYKQLSIVDPLDFHLSVTRVASAKDLEQDLKWCVLCPLAIRRPLATMLDFGIFKSTAFTLLALSGYLTMLGFFIPLTYITPKCVQQGISKTISAYVLSTFGFAHLLGRITCAVINFFPRIRSLPLTMAFIFSAGLSVLISVLASNMYAQFTFSAIYGFSFAFILSLRPILIVELFGLDKLSNSFGILMMFYGLACLMGIPIAGFIHDITNSYDIPYVFASISILLSGLLLIPVPLLLKRERREAGRRRRLSILHKQQRVPEKSFRQPHSIPIPRSRLPED